MGKLTLDKKSYIITISPPYVNSAPHIGYAFEAAIADTLARYLRFLGKPVTFIGSTDDNSFKLVEAAKRAGMDTKAFVEKFAAEYAALPEKLGLSYDVFYRTATKEHGDFVNSLIGRIDRRQIYKDRFKSYFCIDCEQFFGLDIPEPRICPIHNKAYSFFDEENYFLKIDDSDKERLLAELTSKDIFPAEALDLSREIITGYKSFNFTVRNRYDWGLVFKQDPEYVFYSSFDAVLGYLGSCPNQDADWRDSDTCLIQNFGLDILKFHSAYLPLIMLKLGLSPLPDYLLAHGLIQADGAKMSKSKNNAVSVDDLLKKFDPATLRLYLLRHDLFANFDYNEAEIEKIHLIYNKFIDNFLPDIKKAPRPLAANLDLFDTNICNFNFKANIDEFIDLIEKKDNFIDLDPAQTNFLLKFFTVFLSLNTK